MIGLEISWLVRPLAENRTWRPEAAAAAVPGKTRRRDWHALRHGRRDCSSVRLIGLSPIGVIDRSSEAKDSGRSDRVKLRSSKVGRTPRECVYPRTAGKRSHTISLGGGWDPRDICSESSVGVCARACFARVQPYTRRLLCVTRTNLPRSLSIAKSE